MKEQQPLVSICIPTNNRAVHLKTTIESIVNQNEFNSGEVEIIISDNASTDNTKRICQAYASYRNFHYYRNEENVDDRNFPLVLSKANGILRKLNNDTFTLNQGALTILCDLVYKYQASRPFIFLTNDGTEDKKVEFQRFVTEIGVGVTWIAGFTIWDSECGQIENDTDGCKLKLWQMVKAYDIACKKNRIIICNAKIGKTAKLPKKDVSYGLYQVFYCNYMKIIDEYVEKGSLSLDDKAYLKKRLLFDFFAEWIVKYELAKENVKYSDRENLKDAVYNEYQNERYWSDFKKKYKEKLVKAKLKQLYTKMTKIR